MESVYFSGTVCTSRTDEGKIDVNNFHIHHKISVEYSTVLFSVALHHSVLHKFSPKPDTSEFTEFVHIVSATFGLCVQHVCDLPPTAAAAMSFTGAKDLLDSFFSSRYADIQPV